MREVALLHTALVGCAVLMPARGLLILPNPCKCSCFSCCTRAVPEELLHPFNSCYLLWNVLLTDLYLAYIKKIN